MSVDRILQASFAPLLDLVPGLIVTIGTTSAVLFTDLPTTYTIRRVYIYNSHATQTLALFSVPIGQAAASEAVTAGGLVCGPGAASSFEFSAARRILIVGSGASTTFVAVSSDT